MAAREKGLLRVLAAEHSAVETPLPVIGAALNPAAAHPVDGADALEIVGEDEGDLAAKRDGDVVQVLEDVRELHVPLVCIHLLGTGDHDIVLDRLLTFLMQGEDVVDHAADGHLAGEFGLEEPLNELFDLPGVGRVD